MSDVISTEDSTENDPTAPMGEQLKHLAKTIDEYVEEAMEDNPDVGYGDVFYEVAQSVLDVELYPEDVVAEFKRRQGWS